MNTQELINIFSYHPPFGDQEVRYQIIREAAKTLAIHIERWCPRSREKSLAITKLQECVMMANAAIAIHEVEPAPEVAPDDERPDPAGGEFPTLETLPEPPVPVDRAGRPTVDADGDPIAVEDREKAEERDLAEEQAEKEEQQELAEEQEAQAVRDEEADADERAEIEAQEEGII